MGYYILKKGGEVKYKSEEWCNVKAFILGRKSKEDYTLFSIMVKGGKAIISHVYDLESFLKPSVTPCHTTVDIPLKDLEILLKEVKEIKFCNKKSHSRIYGGSGYEGR